MFSQPDHNTSSLPIHPAFQFIQLFNCQQDVVLDLLGLVGAAQTARVGTRVLERLLAQKVAAHESARGRRTAPGTRRTDGARTPAHELGPTPTSISHSSCCSRSSVGSSASAAYTYRAWLPSSKFHNKTTKVKVLKSLTKLEHITGVRAE